MAKRLIWASSDSQKISFKTKKKNLTVVCTDPVGSSLYTYHVMNSVNKNIKAMQMVICQKSLVSSYEESKKKIDA